MRLSFKEDQCLRSSAQHGNIELAGTASAWYERDVAGSTAWAAAGATNVENNMREPIDEGDRRGPGPLG